MTAGASESKPSSATLDLLFQLVREAPDAQLRASDHVDSKIFQAFATASVLIGLAAIQVVEDDRVAAGFASAGVAAFVVAAAVAIHALWSRRYRVTMEPRQLWEKYWSDAPDDIKHAFVADVASGYTENERHLAAKHKALRLILIALLVEASAIGAALIVNAV